MSEIIVEVISHFIDLKPSGNEYKSCCPFHKDKTPSFTVIPNKGYYYCFGCGESGDVFEFVKKIEDCSFPEAIKKIEEVTGLTKEEIMQEKDNKEEIKKEKPTPISKEQLEEFRKDKTYKCNNYRGIKDEYHKFFGHLSKVDEQGNVIAQYYPETYGGKLVGYKSRHHPKNFGWENFGTTGVINELAGQVKFKSGGKYCLIVGGENDLKAAYQMLREHQIERGQEDFNPIPVVSPTSGEGSAAKQCAAQYDWFDTHDIIVIGTDNDPAGIKAAKEIAEVLPKNKVKIASWSRKDPNQMLQEGLQKQFLRDFYGAKDYVSSGIKSSLDCLPEVFEYLSLPRITLPQYMHRLQSKCGGGDKSGILQESVVNIIADTSVGKSTHVNNIVYHLLFNAPAKPGVVSLEATAGVYTLDLISLHIKENLLRKGWSNEKIMEYLNLPEVKARYADLLEDEYGQERFKIIDERTGNLDNLKKQIELMYHRDGVRIFVIDVLTDILRSLGNDVQEQFMMWEKNFVKNGATIFNVMHTRKIPADADGKKRRITEYDALGSSTFPQSAHINICLDRNKMSENSLDKNTTIAWMPKCRGGETGECGGWYYDVPTRQCYDLEDWLKQQPQTQTEEVQEGGVFETYRDYDAEMQYFDGED